MYYGFQIPVTTRGFEQTYIYIISMRLKLKPSCGHLEFEIQNKCRAQYHQTPNYDFSIRNELIFETLQIKNVKLAV